MFTPMACLSLPRYTIFVGEMIAKWSYYIDKYMIGSHDYLNIQLHEDLGLKPGIIGECSRIFCGSHGNATEWVDS